MPRMNSGLLTADKKVAPNAIYQAYRHLLDAVFVQQRLCKKDFENLYVFERFELVKHRFALPFADDPSIELLDDPVMQRAFDLRSEFGQQERDLLSFLMTEVDEDGKCMRLVGEVGTGKSTFLRFMFKDYLPRQEFFRGGKILYVDFSEILISHDCYDYELTVERVCWELLRRLMGSKEAKEEFRVFNEARLLDLLRSLGDQVGQSRVVIVLDNVDTWPTTFQQNLAILVQQLARAARCTVVIAMRPLTAKSFAVDCEGWAPSYLLEQRPPLLHKVIEKRLRQHLESKIDFRLPRVVSMQGSRFTIKFTGIERYISNFINLLMHEKVRQALENLTNYNVRLALLWTLDFLMSWNLDIPQLLGPVFRAQFAKGPVKSLDVMETFILAMGLKDHQMYFPSVSNLENLFSAHLANAEHDLLIKLRCLVYCHAHQPSSNATMLKEHLSKFGYSTEEQHTALNQLVRASRRLLLPLEGGSFESLTQLKISSAGEYYLDDLMYRANYLQMVADDIPLPQPVQVTGGTIYERFHGILDVLETLANQELADYRRFLKLGGEAEELLGLYGDCSAIEKVVQRLTVTVRRLEDAGAMTDRSARTDLLQAVDRLSRRIHADYCRIFDLPLENSG